MPGVGVFCPLGELYPNVGDPTALLDMKNPRPMPFLVRPPDTRRSRTDVTLSHKRAALMALRCRHTDLEGQTVRGTVRGRNARDAADGRPRRVWADVEFGPRLRAQCPVSQLGLGSPENLEAAAKKLLASGPFEAGFQITGWHENDEYLQLSARPAWEAAVHTTLVGQVVAGRVVRVRNPFLAVQLAPFVFASCHAAQLGTERIDDIAEVADVGDTLAVVVTGFDDKGRLQASYREAVLLELERGGK